jgi:hypothetical protein
VNTAIAITAIIAAVVVINIIATTLRDTRTKTGGYIPAIAHCTVDQCTTTGTLANPGGNWTRDDQGRHFCPAHPAATSCRICGRDKGTNRIICGPCARDDSKESTA